MTSSFNQPINEKIITTKHFLLSESSAVESVKRKIMNAAVYSSRIQPRFTDLVTICNSTTPVIAFAPHCFDGGAHRLVSNCPLTHSRQQLCSKMSNVEQNSQNATFIQTTEEHLGK